MKIYKQIIIEIFQKPFRTFILFFTLFILALCMLSSVYIKLAIDASYQKQIEIDGYCIDVEKDNVVEFEDWKKCIDTILSIDGMVGYNNSVEYSTSCKTVGFENCAYEEAKLTKKEKKEVFLVGNIDTKLHSYFRNGKMVLLEGKYPTLEKKGTLIAVELAEKNKIQIGDIVEVESQNEKNIGTEVIGIYETKEIPKIESEHEGFYKKSKNSFIFCDLSTYQQINPNTEKVTILSFFTDNYSILEKIIS